MLINSTFKLCFTNINVNQAIYCKYFVLYENIYMYILINTYLAHIYNSRHTREGDPERGREGQREIAVTTFAFALLLLFISLH